MSNNYGSGTEPLFPAPRKRTIDHTSYPSLTFKVLVEGMVV